MKVVVFTSDKYAWLLRPFAYLFNRFWGNQEVLVTGCREIPALPDNFQVSAHGAGFPVNQWTDAMRDFLIHFPDDHFVLMLEDYFLLRPVDRAGVKILFDSLANQPGVFRLDLTTDVLNGHGDNRYAPEVGTVAHYDLVEKKPGVPYRVSTQAGIFSRKNLLDILEPGKSPWEFEMYSPLPDRMQVWGTRQWPVRYVNALHAGKVNQAEIDRLPPVERKTVMELI